MASIRCDDTGWAFKASLLQVVITSAVVTAGSDSGMRTGVWHGRCNGQLLARREEGGRGNNRAFVYVHACTASRGI